MKGDDVLHIPIESRVEDFILQEEILNRLQDGIFCLDDQWNFLFLNHEAELLLARSKIELKGKNARIEFPDCERFLQHYEQAMLQQTVMEFTEYYTPLQKWFTVRAYPSLSNLIVQFHDITQTKKKTEEIINQSEKLSAIGQLAAGIAHEIRNPLTSLKGFLHLIEVDNSPKSEYFRIMHSEFERIEQILNELLLVAKPQEVQYEKFIIQDILREVITLLESQATLKNIRISMDLAKNQLSVWGVKNQIKQVFINLIKNGMDAMEESGVIHTSIHQDNQDVVIEISDQGSGIPKEKLSQLGQPFYSTKEKGTGLGLMVTYQIVENHQGVIIVKSELNVGTTFIIRLPQYKM
ncbi:ATP-binding protein [Neobacillus sp. D3-1R]|uniref:ATP-binding protein n=1 Tax=Neobacillus sp. D3-1R TaxID=3445778 RepID=UPI003FA0C9F0